MFSHIISRRGEIELRNWKEDEIDDDSGLSIIVPDEKTRISQIRSTPIRDLVLLIVVQRRRGKPMLRCRV